MREATMYSLLQLKEKKEQLEALLLKKAKIFVEEEDVKIEGSAFYLINKINFINFCITNAEEITKEETNENNRF